MPDRSDTLSVGTRVRIIPGFCYSGEFGTVTKMEDVSFMGLQDCRWSLLVRHDDGNEVGYCELDVEVLPLGIATGSA